MFEKHSCNMSSRESIIRAFIASVLMFYAFMSDSFILGTVSIIIFYTAYTKFCFTYYFFKINEKFHCHENDVFCKRDREVFTTLPECKRKSQNCLQVSSNVNKNPKRVYIWFFQKMRYLKIPMFSNNMGKKSKNLPMFFCYR